MRNSLVSRCTSDEVSDVLKMISDRPTNAATEKYLLALRCLNQALALDSSHPRVHEQLVYFRHVLNTSLASLPPKAQEVIKAEFDALDSSVDLKSYNNDFEAKHKDSAPHVISAIKAKKHLGEDPAKVEKELAEVLSIGGVDFQQAGEVLGLLRSWRSREVDDFKKKAATKWPEVTAFA
jgi:N-alpha-acetyltransferase 15/16, NatA auxiliary subunit